MVTLLCLLFTQLSLPSPDADLRLQIINQQIEADPGNAGLLVERGELHAEQEHWGEALHDFDLAAATDPAYARVDFHRGRLFHATGAYAEAEFALKSFLRRSDTGHDATATRSLSHFFLGEIYEHRKQWRDAAHHYDLGIRLSPEANPGFYIARARCLVNAGEHHTGQAIRGLDERLAASPGLLALLEYSVDLEVARGNVDGAVERVERLIAAYPSLPGWRLRLGEIQRANGRLREARQTYVEALEFIQTLPPHRKSKIDRSGVAADIERALAELE